MAAQPGTIAALFGRPGFGTPQVAQRRNVSRNGALDFYPAGGTIDGTKTRDVSNSANSTQNIQAGLLMGKVTATGRYSNSIIALSQAALTGTGTTLTTSAAIAAEIVRRIGTSGTFKLTGPPSAAGVVRTLTVTFSAVNTTTGAVTITALGVNEVQTVNLATAATGGSIKLVIPKTDGTLALTPAAAWSATDATLLANVNTALDSASGVVGGIVATAINATDTDLGFVLTYSGTGYAGLSWPLASVDTLFTGNTGANVVRTTAGVNGAFVTKSLIQPTDGSETIRTMIEDGYGYIIPDDSSDLSWPRIPIAGTIDPDQLINWPADTSLRTYIETALNAVGLWIFGDQF